MLTADSSISAILGGGKQNWHWGRVMKRDFHFVADSHFFFPREAKKANIFISQSNQRYER